MANSMVGFPMFLREQPTSLLVLNSESSLSCRILTLGSNVGSPGSQSGKSSFQGLNANRTLQHVETILSQSGTSCYLKSDSSQLWIFHPALYGLRQTVNDLVHEFNLDDYEPLGPTIALDDLLNDETPEVRDCFLCSIFPTLNRAMTSTGKAIPLGPRTFIASSPSESQGPASSLSSIGNDACCAISMDLEIAKGNLIMSMRQSCNTDLSSVAQLLRSGTDRDNIEDLDAWLAPCGHVTRINNISPDQEQNSTHNVPPQQIGRKHSLVKECVVSRLAGRGITVPKDESWVEVNVIVPSDRVGVSEPDERQEENLQMLRSILWPSSLVFTNRVSGNKEKSNSKNSLQSIHDPLKVAEEWFRDSAARADRIGKRKAAKVAEQMQRERLAFEALNRDDVPAPSPTIIRTYTDANSAAAIYPTPPDGTLSHVTPGMSSIDGAGITPGGPSEQSRAPNTEHRDDDVEMADADEGTAADFFHDDLFEDNPGENSESGEMDNDPDWGFFDEPDTQEDTKAMIDDMDVEKEDEGEGRPSSPQGSEPAQKGLLEDSAPSLEYVEEQTAPGRNDLPMEKVGPGDRPSQDAKGDERASIDEQGRNINDHRVASQLDTGIAGSTSFQDSKYSAEGGRFWFGQQVAGLHSDHHRPIPNKYQKTPAIFQGSLSVNGGDQVDALQDDTSDVTTSYSDGSTPFDSSELFSEDDAGHDPWTALKRKWTETVDSVPALEAGPDDSEQIQARSECCSILDYLFDDPGHWPMDDSLQVANLEQETSTTSDDEVQLGELLVDQASQSFLLQHLEQIHLKNHPEMLPVVPRSIDLGCGSFSQKSFQELCHICDLSNDMSTSYASFDTPKVRLKRGDRDLEGLPPLLRFWETFGLQPAAGSKDITAFCLYPSQESLNDCCAAFLSHIGQIYKASNLGDFRRGTSTKLIKDGLIVWKRNRSNPSGDFSDICKDLGRELSHAPITSTIVLYIVHPLERPEVLIDICRSMLALFRSYAKSSQERPKMPPEMVCRIVPMSFIAVGRTLSVNSHAEYLRLALETYNSCPSSRTPGDEVASVESAVLLANPSLTSIKFNLASSHESPIGNDNVLHVAYSQSTDERWITAAWTDNYGKRALTMTYCLRSRNTDPMNSRPIYAIVKEIWGTSMDIISSSAGLRRIVVCREGSISDIEKNAWIHQVNSQASASMPDSNEVALLLLVVDTEPPFQLLPSSDGSGTNRLAAVQQTRVPAQNTPTTANFPPSSSNPLATYGTPASTPTPTASQSVLSPEQIMTANTPGAVNAPTPTPSGSTLGHSHSQSAHVVAQSPAAGGARVGLGQPQTPQPQQASGINSQTHVDIQATLESDATSILSSTSSDYFGIISPYPLSISRSLLDHRAALASAYILRHRIAVDTWKPGPSPSLPGIPPETVLSVSLVWTSLPGLPLTSDTHNSRSQETLTSEIAETQRTKKGDDASGSDSVPDQATSALLDTSQEPHGLQPDSDSSAQLTSKASHLLLHEVLPLYRNLITLSETKGVGFAMSPADGDGSACLAPTSSDASSHTPRSRIKVLPWHIMTAVRGRRILEKCGL